MMVRAPPNPHDGHSHDHDHDHSHSHDHPHSHGPGVEVEEEEQEYRDPLLPEVPLPLEPEVPPVRRTPSSNPLLELILTFNDLQSERVRAFRMLDQSFVEYIASKNGQIYQSTLLRVASVFRNSKLRITEIQGQLEKSETGKVAAEAMGKVNQLEFDKLVKTGELQKLKAETLLGESDYGHEIAKLETELRGLTDEVNEQMEVVAAEKAEL